MEKQISDQGARKHLVIEHASRSRLLPSVSAVFSAHNCLFRDECELWFKIAGVATVAGLITDDESLYIASEGSTMETCSIPTKLLFELNRSNSEEEAVTAGET